MEALKARDEGAEMKFCIYRARQGWSPGGRPRSCHRKLRSRSREVWRAKHPWGRRGNGMGNRAAGWSDRKEPLLQDSRGPSQMGRLSPCPAPASLRHVHKGARWGANLGHSLCRPPFVSCQGPEWSGEAWPGVPSTGCSGQCHCLKLLRTGLPGPLELGLAAVLQSSSSAHSLPMGATKIMQRPLQCSPCGIMAEQSWGHRPSSPVCDDGPRPG